MDENDWPRWCTHSLEPALSKERLDDMLFFFFNSVKSLLDVDSHLWRDRTSRLAF